MQQRTQPQCSRVIEISERNSKCGVHFVRARNQAHVARCPHDKWRDQMAGPRDKVVQSTKYLLRREIETDLLADLTQRGRFSRFVPFVAFACFDPPARQSPLPRMSPQL